MLNFQKLRIFLANTLLELFALHLPVRPDVHQCGEPESGRPVIILDDVGIGIDNHPLAARAFDPEGADAVI